MAQKRKRYRVAADIGGTFTDVVAQDVKTGDCHATKVLSIPSDPALAVVNGIEAAIAKTDEIEFFVHGTTVGLNAVLTRSGARVALLTTRYFRDIYTIQGNDRGEIFSIRWNKSAPLVPLENTYTARERTAADGEVVEPLNLGDVEDFADAVEAGGFESVAICFLFSFQNPVHELAAEEILRRRLPGIDIALSHRVSPEWREFERTSTTVMDSYVAPVIRGYLRRLAARIGDRLPAGRALHVMESNGGVMSTVTAGASPLQTLLSGPVGGAIGGRALAAATGRKNLICIDMGGTSFDASLIIDGSPSTSNEARIEGLPVQMSIVDINVIGAGGGSIAWEEAGAIRVGPQSAGSEPGPICYGLGGDRPTVSDANLVLGRLDGANFAGSRVTLDAEGAEQAMRSMGARFGLDAFAMAQGIVDIINAKMADAIRTITVRRGIDPRDFTLVAFGGAGPSQAAALAYELGTRDVVIPVFPGAFSAWGMLQTDVRHDFKSTHYGFWDQMAVAEIQERFSDLEREGLNELVADGVSKDEISFERAIDFRYHGQEYVLTIALPPGLIDLAKIRASFDDAYARQYGHNNPEARVEMTNLRVAALGKLDRPPAAEPGDAEPSPERSRSVYFSGKAVQTAILQRAAIGAKESVYGPSIIEEGTATTLVPPGWIATTIAGGHLLLSRLER
ncbi:MAG: hydantoinase/oxoprolinase family protein [Chloroflexi bacterium]|nr:hydantoinase/oxoprolinase family protein [Chloroflexota bacterium]MYC47043.1 hydantoinase/oxoprolinase family protein [Chloroflexota bacterium]